jgi:hypothetical protein
MRFIHPLALGLVLAASPLAAQQTATVSGRVVERGGNVGILGVTVELSGLAPVLTGADGTFLLREVVPGAYTLSITALGYTGGTSDIRIAGDTTLVIELDRAPIRLDSLVVRGRDVTVKGEVKDKERGVGLLDVEVYASNGLVRQTDGIGRFKFDDVPANVPFAVRVEEFGYLPLTATIAPDNDTTLQFELVPDPIVAKMIEQQIVRIADRAGDIRYPYVEPIDRDELMKSRNGTVYDLISRIYSRRIGCIAIDERTYSREVRDGILKSMRTDEIEHIDALWYGSGKRSLLLRIYTRDFVRRMITNSDILISHDDLLNYGRNGDCR